MLPTKVLCMLICSSFVVASTEIATLNYFGLTFTPTNIIASRFDANDVIEIMRYPTSTQYLLFYRNTIQNIGKDEDIYESRKFHETKEYNATVSLFRNAIAPVTHNLHNKLGLKPIYASLYLSSIFHSNVVSAAADAILPAWEEGIETRYGTHRGAALYDYHFLEGKHIRPAPEECDGYCPESLVLLLEYEEEYLYVWLIVVDPEINSYFTQAKEICVECGEGTRKVDSIEYQQRISDLIRKLVSDNLSPYYQQDDIRAIVISGEASLSGISELGSIALNAVGTDAVKLITAIEPANVGAHGAAVWAQKSHQDPDAWWSCPPRLTLAWGAHSSYTGRLGDDIPTYNKLIGAGDVPMNTKLIEAGDEVIRE